MTRLKKLSAPNVMIPLLITVSALAVLFLFWLIYFQEGPTHVIAFSKQLPLVNASLNGASAIALLTGLFFILKKNKKAHMKSMIAAFIFSALFLITYIAYYALHGNTIFTAQGLIRPIYFFTLISHIGLTIIGLPLILITFYWAFSQHFVTHKKVARLTFPIWLYNSITGVFLYILQRIFNG